MSKFFYKGGSMKKPEHSSAGFEVSKTVRLGTEKAPAKVSVKNTEREEELKALFTENNWVYEITVDSDAAENTRDLEILQDKQESVAAVTTKTASRNDPCPCGSGKKYKKCCAA